MKGRGSNIKSYLPIIIIKKDCKDITGTTCSYKDNTSGLVYNIPSLFFWQEKFQFIGNVIKYRCVLLLAWQYRGITLFLEFLFTVFSFHLLLWFHLFLWLLLLLSLLLLSLYCSCFCDFCSKHCCFLLLYPSLFQFNS